MAQRRMISKEICESKRYLNLNYPAQALLTQLVVHADDDGIAEAYAVLQLTGIQMRSLKELEEENFIVFLNKDMVVYIPDWLRMNKIRSDRKQDSYYLPLLLRVLPDVKYIKSTKRADRKENKMTKINNELEQPLFDDTEVGRPMDALVQDRLGQVSIEQQQLPQLDVPQQAVVEEVSEIDLRKEFANRNLPTRLAVNWQQQFTQESILKQLHNYDLNKNNIQKPIGWLYNAIKNDYEVYGSKIDERRTTITERIKQTQREFEAESKQLTSVGEIIVHNKQLAAMAAKHVKVRLVENCD